jgi:NTE family protein
MPVTHGNGSLDPLSIPGCQPILGKARSWRPLVDNLDGATRGGSDVELTAINGTRSDPQHTHAGSRAVRPTTAFVLGGGGNLGAVQIGMLRALHERGITPDLLLGCSAGALNAAGYAEQPTLEGIVRMERTWAEAKGDEVFPGLRFVNPWLLLRRGPSMCANHGLRSLIERSLRIQKFEDATIPFEVVATELLTGREQWFDRGDIIEPIIASASIPAVLPPVLIDGEHFIDGGVVENVPIERARQRGCTRIVVLHVGNFARPKPRFDRPLDYLLHSLSLARGHEFVRQSTRSVDGIELIVLPAVDPGNLRRNDFSRGRELMRRAHDTASRYLDDYLTLAATA